MFWWLIPWFKAEGERRGLSLWRIVNGNPIMLTIMAAGKQQERVARKAELILVPMLAMLAIMVA